MDKVDRPRGLIAFDSDRNTLLHSAGQPSVPRTKRLVRARTIAYAALILVIGAIILATLGSRNTIDVSVLHDRNPVFVTLSDGSIRNGYTVRILNKELETREFALAVDGPPGMRVTVLGFEDVSPEDLRLPVAANGAGTYRAFLTLPRDQFEENPTRLDFTVTDLDTGEIAHHDTVFRGPE